MWFRFMHCSDNIYDEIYFKFQLQNAANAVDRNFVQSQVIEDIDSTKREQQPN